MNENSLLPEDGMLMEPTTFYFTAAFFPAELFRLASITRMRHFSRLETGIGSGIKGFF